MKKSALNVSGLAVGLAFLLAMMCVDINAQTINIGPNQYAFRFTQNPNYGLFFNSTNVQYEFRNGAAAPIFGFNADNGNMTTNLQFASGSSYLVAPGNYAIRSALAANAGIFFGNTDFEFRTVGGASGITMNATTGSTTFSSPISAPGGNSNLWNQAHSWGNHAQAGYISAETDPKIDPQLVVNNVPRWDGSKLASSSITATNVTALITGVPGTLGIIGGPPVGHLLRLENPGSTNPLFSTSESRISFSKADVQFGLIGTNGNNFNIQAFSTGSLVFRTSTNDRMIIASNGNIGIGNAPVSGVRLAVNGQVLATSMKVQALANWPDYVFEPGYERFSIEELEAFVLSNKHLPGVPSAAEIEAEEGFELGDMQKRTLEKVEELTLYLIEQNKLIKSQEETLKQQQELLMQQREELNILKERLR